MVHRLLFYVLLVMLPTQLGYHWWPDWSLVLGRRMDYLSPTLFVTDIVLVSLLVAYAIEIIVQKQSWVLSRTTQFGIGVFLLLAIANTLWSVSPVGSAYAWLRAIAYLLLIAYVIATKPPYRTVMALLVIAASYSSALAIAQTVTGRSLGGIFWWIGERSFDTSTPGIARVDLCSFSWLPCKLALRPYATFPHPNVLGGFLAALLAPAVHLLGSAESKKVRILLGFGITLMVIALVLTVSRSAWIAVTIGCILASGIASPTRLGMRLSIASVTIACTFVLAWIAGPYFATLTTDSESVVYRMDLLRAARSMVRSHAYTGVGLNGFLTVLPNFVRSREIWFLQPVHNIYLLFVSEVGIIGVLVIVTLVAAALRQLTKRKSHIRTIALIPIVVLAITGLFDHYPLTLQQGRLILALSVALPFLP